MLGTDKCCHSPADTGWTVSVISELQ